MIWWWVAGAHHVESAEGGVACCTVRIPEGTPVLRCAVPPESLCGGCRRALLLWSDPETVRSIERGLADHAAGRWYHWNDGDPTPNPDWPPDGPQPQR